MWVRATYPNHLDYDGCCEGFACELIAGLDVLSLPVFFEPISEASTAEGIHNAPQCSAMLHNAPQRSELRALDCSVLVWSDLVHSGAFCMNGTHAKPGPAGCIVEHCGASELSARLQITFNSSTAESGSCRRRHCVVGRGLARRSDAGDRDQHQYQGNN